MIDVGAVVDVEDLHTASVLVDAVDDAVGAPTSTVAAGQRAGQRLSDSLRVGGERSIAELHNGGGDGFGQPVGDRAPSGWLEPDVIPPCRRR